MPILPRRFYARPALAVALDLLGCSLTWRDPRGAMTGRIVEVEAYEGADDPASHAFRGPTARNHSMFGPPGHAYVYFTYGMHHCVNAVTGAEGLPHAVLLRALQPTRGLARWRAARPDLPLTRIASGPGRLCRALGLDRSHDGFDLTRSALTVHARPPGFVPGPICAGPRIGIRLARAAPYRLWLPGEPAVSRAGASEPARGRPYALLTRRGGRP